MGILHKILFFFHKVIIQSILLVCLCHISIFTWDYNVNVIYFFIMKMSFHFVFTVVYAFTSKKTKSSRLFKK